MKNTIRNLSKETLREYIENWTYHIEDYSDGFIWDTLSLAETMYCELNNEEVIEYDDSDEDFLKLKTKSKEYIFNTEDKLYGYTVAMGDYKQGFINIILVKEDDIIGLFSIKLDNEKCDIFRNQQVAMMIKRGIEKLNFDYYIEEDDYLDICEGYSVFRDENDDIYIEFNDMTIETNYETIKKYIEFLLCTLEDLFFETYAYGGEYCKSETAREIEELEDFINYKRHICLLF